MDIITLHGVNWFFGVINWNYDDVSVDLMPMTYEPVYGVLARISGSEKDMFFERSLITTVPFWWIDEKVGRCKITAKMDVWNRPRSEAKKLSKNMFGMSDNLMSIIHDDCMASVCDCNSCRSINESLESDPKVWKKIEKLAWL